MSNTKNKSSELIELVRRFWHDIDYEFGEFKSTRSINMPEMRCLKVNIDESKSVMVAMYSTVEVSLGRIPTLQIAGVRGYKVSERYVDWICALLDRVLWETNMYPDYSTLAHLSEEEGCEDEWDIYIYENGSPKFILGDNWLKL